MTSKQRAPKDWKEALRWKAAGVWWLVKTAAFPALERRTKPRGSTLKQSEQAMRTAMMEITEAAREAKR